MSYFRWQRVYEKSNAPNATKLTVDNLTPFTNYTLRMYSQNVKGRSEPSVSTELFETLASVPSVPPGYLAARQDSLYQNTNLSTDANVLIKWTPIPSSQWNGIMSGYVLQVSTCDLADNKTIKIETRQQDPTVYLLKHLQAFQCYRVRMCAWNSVGLGPWTPNTLIINRTSEAQPWSGPTHVNLYSVNSTCIKVVWSKLAPRFASGILIGYNLKYTAEDGRLGEESNQLFVSNDSEMLIRNELVPASFTILLTNLFSFTNYKIEIAGCTRAGCGVFSSPVSLKTAENLASQPVSLYFGYVNLTSVRLEWQEPARPNGLISAYRVRYILKRQLNANKPDTQQHWSLVYVRQPSGQAGINQTVSCEVNALTKMEYYVFEVCANNTSELGWGEPATAFVYTMDRRAAPDPTSKPAVSKSSIKSNEVTINWSAGPDNYSPIRYFSVQMMLVDSGGNTSGQNWHNVAKYPIDTTESSYTLKIGGLMSNGRVYRFRISATNDVGTSGWSPVSDLIRTKYSKPKYSPINLIARPISGGRLQLSWYEQVNLNETFANDFLIKYKLVYRLVSDGGEAASLMNAVEMQIDYNATMKKQMSEEDTNSLLKHEYILENQLFSFNGTYEVRLCGINQVGQGKCALARSLVYMEDTLPTLKFNDDSRSVELIKSIETLSSTELNLTWMQPQEELVNGKLYAVKIVYFINNNQDPNDFEQFIQNKDLKAAVKLPPTESQPLSNLNDLDEFYLNYPLRLHKRDTPTQSRALNVIIVEPNSTSILINNLKPFTAYSVFIQLVNQAGESPSPLNYLFNEATNSTMRREVFNAQFKSAQTYQSTPSMPAKLVFSFVAYTFLNLTWLKPEMPNGQILSYEVWYENLPPASGDPFTSLTSTKYNSFKTNIVREQINTNLNASFHTLHVTNLEPNMEYKFKVRCRTVVDWGPYIEKTVRTGPQFKKLILSKSGEPDEVIEPPTAPSKPMFTDLNETHALLEWKPFSANHKLFLVQIKHFYLSSADGSADVIMDEALNGSSIDLHDNFRLLAYTNQSRLLIDKEEALNPYSPFVIFRVFSFNFIGISEPSAASELVHVKSALTSQAYDGVRKDNANTSMRYFLSSWWFLALVGLVSLALITIIVLGMCMRGKNNKFLLKRDKKQQHRNTMRMMKMNQSMQSGATQQTAQGNSQFNTNSTMQTNLRLDTLLDNLTGSDSIDLSLNDNLGQYLTSVRQNAVGGKANIALPSNNSSQYYLAGSNAQLILTDTSSCLNANGSDSNYATGHNQMVYDFRKSKRAPNQGSVLNGTIRTATYVSPNGTLSKVNFIDNNGFTNDNNENQACTNTLGKQQLNPRNLNSILNGFFTATAQPNDYSSSGHIGQLINNSQFNTLKSNKQSNHYLLPCNPAGAGFDQPEGSNQQSEEPQTPASELSSLPAGAQFYYGQQNYGSFSSSTNPRSSSGRNGHVIPIIRLDNNTNSIRGVQAMNNPTPAAAALNDRNAAMNFSNRKIYTTSSFGRQPQQQQQQGTSGEAPMVPTFQDRRMENASNYASNRYKTLNMNTYYDHQQVYQMSGEQQAKQPTYHTHMAQMEMQQYPPVSAQSPPPPSPPPPPPPPPPPLPMFKLPPMQLPISQQLLPQLPELPRNLPPTFNQTDIPNSNPNQGHNEPTSSISINLKSGDRVVMNNTAGSRKPLTGFSSFV